MLCDVVLYLYEFTLLSNMEVDLMNISNVLYLYEFTLLSNKTLMIQIADWSFIPL